MYYIEVRGKGCAWRPIMKVKHPYWGFVFKYPLVALIGAIRSAKFNARNRGILKGAK